MRLLTDAEMQTLRERKRAAIAAARAETKRRGITVHPKVKEIKQKLLGAAMKWVDMSNFERGEWIRKHLEWLRFEAPVKELFQLSDYGLEQIKKGNAWCVSYTRPSE